MILDTLLKPIAHEVTAQALQHEQKVRSEYGEDFIAKPYNTTLPPGIRAKSAQRTEVVGRVQYVRVAGQDMYGNEKSGEVRYFECLNCGRKIAGSRFAAHMERCLNGRNSRKGRGTAGVTSSGYNSVSVSPSASGIESRASPSVSPAKKKKRTGPIGKVSTAPKRQGSEGPPPKTAVSKFFDRDKTRKAYSTPASPVERSRVSMSHLTGSELTPYIERRAGIQSIS